MAERYKGDVIVPMTVTNRAYYEELIGALAQDFEVRHIILCASREVLLKRLASRLEGSRSWGAQQISRCLQAFASDIPGLKLQTGALNLYQVTEAAAALAGVELAPDLRCGFLEESRIIGPAAYCTKHKVECWHPLCYDMTEDVVRELKDAKVQINAWTVNRREDMEDMLRKGIDGVITNFPELFSEVRASFI